MISTNTFKPVLFRLHETKIFTNAADSEESMRHTSSLGFSLINSSDTDIILEGVQNCYILLTFHIGQSSESLFPDNTADSDFGTIYGPEGFMPSKILRNPIKKNQIRMQLALKDNTTRCFAAGEILSFSWENLITTASEGSSTLSLSFSGIDTLEGLLLTQTLYKETIYANIANFYTSPSGGAPGSKLTLYWKTENAESGSILPLGYDIFSNDLSASSSLDIILTENTHYYLNINNKHGNTYEETFAQLLPPCIAAMEISAGILSWEVHFASKVELMTQNIYETVESTGTAAIKQDVKTASLRCSGLYTLERRMELSSLVEIPTFCLDIWTFPAHQCLTLNWCTKGLKSINLYAWDTESYLLSTEARGTYEQVYEPNIHVSFRLDYECASGHGSLYLTNQNINPKEVSFHVSIY